MEGAAGSLEVGVEPVDFRVFAPGAPGVLGALAFATEVVDAIATTLMLTSLGITVPLWSRGVVAGTCSPLGDVEVMGVEPAAGDNDDDEVLSSGAVDVADVDVVDDDVAGDNGEEVGDDEVWSART